MEKTRIPIEIITCPMWGAAAPLADLTVAGKAGGVIIHHTAGHHREISDPLNESEAESMRYAKDIQHSHQSPSKTDPTKPWLDSGHNFLVCRNGLIFQGRWMTVKLIEAGLMVVSAHCPGRNTWIGIEHEHKGTEPLTPIQREASSRLQAWIAGQYKRKLVLPADPHSKYVNTTCPANLINDIVAMKKRAQAILTAARAL